MWCASRFYASSFDEMKCMSGVVNEGWRLATDAARITDENADTEDRKHTSGGVFVVVDSRLGAVVGQMRKRLNQSQATKEESPKHGLMYEEVCVSSR